MRIMASVFILLLMALNIYEVEASEHESTLIRAYEEDVTGDGKLDRIELYGIPFSAESVYYRDIYALVQSETDNWRINYQGGYDPTIQFVDLNHDGVLDLFYQSPTGGSGGLYTSRLDSLNNQTLVNIPLPEQDYVNGYFADDFQAILEIAPHSQPIVINVENRKEDYLRLGIFNQDGKLLNETPLMIDPIAFFEPVEISERQGYGLKSYKQVSGAYHADQLGIIETFWYYENGKWTAIQTDWIEAGDYDASKFY